MKFIPSVPPLNRHGVGWIFITEHDRSCDIRVIAMGVVKPANDDEEFYRLKDERDLAYLNYLFEKPPQGAWCAIEYHLPRDHQQ